MCLGANRAMPVHFAMVVAHVGTGAAESDAIGQLRFQKLPMPGLVRARHDAARGVADGGAIEIETDAGYETRHVALGQAGVGAGRAGFDATKTGVNASAHGLRVGGFLGVRTEHGADGNGGHEAIPFLPPLQNTPAPKWFRV